MVDVVDSDAPDAVALFGIVPVRLQILRLVVAHDEVTAFELMDALSLSRNGVGYHLNDLTAAGFLVERSATHPRGTGNLTYWRADRERIARAMWELDGMMRGYGQSNSRG